MILAVFKVCSYGEGGLHGLTGSPGWLRIYSTCPGYIRRVFHLSLGLITFGGRSAHLEYVARKRGRKTATLKNIPAEGYLGRRPI